MNVKTNKIKACVIGTGDWGARVADVFNLISRFDLVGTINSTTTDDKKNKILNEADFWYIATPSDKQFPYIENGILSKKHIICESPMCGAISERKQVYDLLLQNVTGKMFYCNFPYLLDPDFGRLFSGGKIKDGKFFSIKSFGPKFKDSPEQAKKFYINQALNLIFSISSYIEIKNFDRFIIKDDFVGEFHAKDITFLFEWGYSEYPKLELTIKGKDFSNTSELVYDEYDQTMPLLVNFSDKILDIDETFEKYKHINASMSQAELIHKLSLSSFLISSSAEYFSDIFCKMNGSFFESFNPIKLFLDGGFDESYSILNNDL